MRERERGEGESEREELGATPIVDQLKACNLHARYLQPLSAKYHANIPQSDQESQFLSLPNLRPPNYVSRMRSN